MTLWLEAVFFLPLQLLRLVWRNWVTAYRDNVEIVSSLDCVQGNDSLVMVVWGFVCVCACVCERKRQTGRERQRKRERKRDRCRVMMACTADGRGLPLRTWWMADDVIKALTCCNCSSEEAKPRSELWIWSPLYILHTKDIFSVSTLGFMLFKTLPPPTAQPKEGWWIFSARRKMSSLYLIEWLSLSGICFFFSLQHLALKSDF